MFITIQGPVSLKSGNSGLGFTEATTMSNLPTKATRTGLELTQRRRLSPRSSSTAVLPSSTVERGYPFCEDSGAPAAQYEVFGPDPARSNHSQQPVQPGGVIRSRLTAELASLLEVNVEG